MAVTILGRYTTTTTTTTATSTLKIFLLLASTFKIFRSLCYCYYYYYYLYYYYYYYCYCYYLYYYGTAIQLYTCRVQQYQYSTVQYNCTRPARARCARCILLGLVSRSGIFLAWLYLQYYCFYCPSACTLPARQYGTAVPYGSVLVQL